MTSILEKFADGLVKGGPGSGPHPGYTHAASVADAASKAAKDASQKVRDAPANQKEYEHQNASDAHAFAAKEHGKAADLASTPQERFRHSAAADEHSARAESHKESRDKLAARSRR